MPFGVMQRLNVVLCKDAQHAIDLGYNQVEEYQHATPVEIEKVVIVRDGTATGNPTVDLVLHDQAGNKFVVMVTGRLLKALPL